MGKAGREMTGRRFADANISRTGYFDCRAVQRLEALHVVDSLNPSGVRMRRRLYTCPSLFFNNC